MTSSEIIDLFRNGKIIHTMFIFYLLVIEYYEQAIFYII